MPAEKAAGGNGSEASAKPKLLPWEPQSLPVAATTAPKPDEKRTAKTAEKTDDKPAPKPRPETKPADSGQESG